jgi:uncharacterized protein (TIGR03382 family)
VDTAAPTAATPESDPTPAPLAIRRTPQPVQARFDPTIAAEGAAGTAAVALVAGALVVRRRRLAPVPTGPETDIRIDNGFAEADPVEGLARRLDKPLIRQAPSHLSCHRRTRGSFPSSSLQSSCTMQPQQCSWRQPATDGPRPLSC